jgi:hypothetical protein
MKIDMSLGERKSDLMKYFKSRASEILKELTEELGKRQYKSITQALQPDIRESRDSLTRTVEQTAKRERWNDEALLRAILLIHHVANVAMLEYRHKIWPYEYMAFSRRVGELWESFVGTCFHYPLTKDLILEIPPLFSDVRNKLEEEIIAYIDKLPLRNKQKAELRQYYSKVWLLVDAGEIKLELDMHFLKGKQHYNIDFKSGFGSNEKGNTNRLLVVGSIYKNIIDADYKNLILVRTPEEGNNHYLQILNRSKLWEVSCSSKAYAEVNKLVGFDLHTWIAEFIDWESDLDSQVVSDLRDADLLKYLEW